MTLHQRSEWNAAPPKKVGDALVNEPYGAVHDIGGGDPYPSNIAATLHQIQATEQHGEYVDIAYNVGVDEYGDEWVLRGDVADGATKGYSGKSFSVLAICNASHPEFVTSKAMLEGIGRAFRRAQDRGVLARTAYIDGHHWFDTHETPDPTACPGPPLIASIPIIRSYVTGPPKPIPQPKEDDMGMVVTHGDGTPAGRKKKYKLFPDEKAVLCSNGGRLVGDSGPTPLGCWWHFKSNGRPDGLCLDDDGQGIVVTAEDDGTFVAKFA